VPRWPRRLQHPPWPEQLTFDQATERLPCDVASVAIARRLVDQHLGVAGIKRDVTYTAVLLTSELATNAVLHSGCEHFTVEVTQIGGASRIAVSDCHPNLRPRRDDDDEGGRGLALVADLAERWGIQDQPAGAGKTVWFELSSTWTPTPLEPQSCP
jgi:anti-sigma regulatory factor (Ser/Thr protein kinase)